MQSRKIAPTRAGGPAQARHSLSTELLISSDPLENRVALLENGALVEIYIEREEKVIGSIFKGKVQNVLPGMGASFVDIGLGRNAFLYVDDINKTPLNIGDVEITQGRPGWTITEKVNRGDEVLVQIVKEPRGLKGARISTNISLPGRYLILMPNGKYSGVSRKVATSAERDRLKSIMKLIRPEGMATVVRTAASGISQAELIADLGVLIRMWHGILESFKRAPAPALIHKDMNLVYKAARDFITPEVERVLIDNGEEFEKVRDFMRLLGPQYVERIQHYNSGRSLFKDFKIDDEIDRLLKPMVKLPSGGSIVIESTEALTVIDVNSGKFTGGKNLEDTIVKTNIEAAAEIARQIRLRDIVGIIDRNSATNYSPISNVHVNDTYVDDRTLDQNGNPLVLPVVYLSNKDLKETLLACVGVAFSPSCPNSIGGYTLASPLPWNPDLVLTTIPQAKRTYDQFTFTVRTVQPRWRGEASMTEARLRGNTPGVAGFGTTGTRFSAGPYAHPNEAINDDGALPDALELEGKVWLSFQLPYAMQGGLLYTHTLGERFTAGFQFDGRFRYVDDSGAVLPFQAFKSLLGQTLFLEPRGSRHYASRDVVDLHLERRSPKFAVVTLDLFNALGSNALTSVNSLVGTRIDSDPTSYFMAERLRVAPRTLRIGLRVD